MTTKCLPVLLAALACFGCGGGWEEERSDPDFSSGTYAETMATWASRPCTTGGIMMVGDSITCLWPEDLLPETAKKRGICGDTTKGVLHRLWLIEEEAPDALFLLIGVNNFVYGQIYEAPADVGEILAELQTDLPATDIYLLSILPTADSDLPNHVIAQINFQYRNLCAQHGSCEYVDLYSWLYLPGVGLAQSEDGLHPNRAGYEVMARALAPYWARYPASTCPLRPAADEKEEGEELSPAANEEDAASEPAA